MSLVQTPHTPSLGLGGSVIGNCLRRVSDEDVERLLLGCLEAGVTFWDTSSLYGFGLSEERIGEFLARHQKHDSVQISTKVGFELVPWDGRSPRNPAFLVPERPLTTRSSFDGESLARQLEEARRRLQVGHRPFAVVHVHDLDLGTSWGNSNCSSWDSSHFETFVERGYPTLAAAKRDGLISGIGAGINQAQMISRLLDHVELDYVLPATRTTLLDHKEGLELCRKCVRLGVKVIAASPFLSSRLLREGAAAGAKSSYGLLPAPPEEVLSRVAAIERVCQEFDVPLAAAALQFPLRLPAVQTLLVGMGSIEELQENLKLVRLPVPEEFWQELQRRELTLV